MRLKRAKGSGLTSVQGAKGNGRSNGHERLGVAVAARRSSDRDGASTPAIKADQTLTDRDQTRADTDQTASDTDQTAAEGDQAAADRDQAAAESDQAASDRNLAAGSDPTVHGLTRDLRERSAQQRQHGAEQRSDVAGDRERAAQARDLGALARDRAAELNDRVGFVSEDRKRAADDRVAAAEGRARGFVDREDAEHDREQAARDRSRGREDHDALMARLTIVETEERAARARAEDALRESEERYRLLAQNSSDVIMRVSSDAIVGYVSPASRPVFGYEPEEIVGRSYSWGIHPENRVAVRNAVAAFMAGSGRTATYEYRAQRRDGSYVWVESRLRRLGSPTAGGADEFQSATRDITERKDADAETARAQQAAERANRAKSEFVSRMSHELRTPLNAIIGFGQVLDLQRLSTRQHEEVEHILKAGKHLLALINDVLDISRIEAGGVEPFLEPALATEAVREALLLVAPIAAERHIEINADMRPGDDRHLHADRRLLAQVLLNLLSNAIKYNREGGRIDVSLVTTESGRIQMLVADTGPGIAPEQLTRLFEPFDRLGAEYTDTQGSGLGLALSKALIEAMGGSIAVESTLGRGSTFIIELDAAQAPDGAAHLARLNVPPPVTGNELGLGQRRILYIEDNLANLMLVERILDHQAARVELIPAMQGRLGLELARDHHLDLILLDVHLPDLPGIEVLRRLRAQEDTREIPVVVLSADASVNQIKALRDAGACDYLTKPLDVRRFLEVLATNLKAPDHPHVPDPHARIMIVDDVQGNVVLLETLLSAWGYDNLVCTTDSSTALRLCLEREPDLLLLDLQMPSPDGYEVMKALGETDVPILVLTANLSESAQARARDLGANDFAGKPFDHDELHRQITRLL
ncbi:MAG TPA: response regulator [Solirubrobacteraceae bacterium]|nr:response regulator [Solirubrobacteraceae bacterium]